MSKVRVCIILCFILLVSMLLTISQIFAATCGDTNSDGNINITDALLIAQYSVGVNSTNFDQGAADVNGDNSIKITDALLLAQYYVGIVDSLSCQQATGLETVFAVNCGGSAYTASDGTKYSTDSGYSGGNAYDNGASVSGTSDPTLYSTERYGNSNYSVNVPNGEYQVTLHFAENYHTSAGSRVFNVNMEGSQAISNLDIYGKAGVNTAYVTENKVSVYDGELNIEFITVTENAVVNAIKVDVLSYSSTTPANTITTNTPIVTNIPTTGGKFHVFLLLGQSNMAGYPTPQAADKVPDDRVLVLDYDSNQWRVAVPPLHESSWNNSIGPGDWFGKTIVNRIPAGDTIGLVPCAISGEKIETFMKNGGSKYNWIIQRAQLAQQRGGIIEGILFHQGESNNGDTNWPGNVNTLVTDLRRDLNLGNIPFLAGELLYSGGCSGHNVLINRLPSVVSNCYVVSASGLVVDPSDTQWKLHFGHDSQVELGKRYAQKMIEALGW